MVMTENPNPEMYEGTLDSNGIEALFRDLEAYATVHHVQVRAANAAYTGGENIALTQAKQQLEDGQATAVQIRYEHEGDPWCDTLIARGDLVRIVRMKQQPSA